MEARHKTQSVTRREEVRRVRGGHRTRIFGVDVTLAGSGSSYCRNQQKETDHGCQQVKLTLMINVINGWNRIAVGFGGWVDPAAVKSAAEAAAA